MQTSAELKAEAAAARKTASEALKRAQGLAAAARKAEQEERWAAERAARDGHYLRLLEDVGRPWGLNEAQHSIVYAVAYEQGHAYGYDEVGSRYDELAEMARKILQAR